MEQNLVHLLPSTDHYLIKDGWRLRKFKYLKIEKLEDVYIFILNFKKIYTNFFLLITILILFADE